MDDDDDDLPVVVQQWLETYNAYSTAADGDLDRIEKELDALEFAMTPEQRVVARDLGGQIAKRIEREDE
jgi:hypothetical protein